MKTPLITLALAGLLVPAAAAAQDAQIITVHQAAVAQQDPGQDPVVEVIPVDPTPVQVVIDQQQDQDQEPCCEDPPEPITYHRSDRSGPIGSLGVFVDSLSLAMGHGIDDAGADALAGRQLPSPDRLHVTTGGVMFASGYRPKPWLRAPEMRLYLGGGSVHNGAWAPVAGADGFEMRASDVFVVRFDVVFGFQPRIGEWFRPFVLARLGYAGYFVSAQVRHRDIGGLADESVRDGMFEAGVDAGFAARLGDKWQMALAYRGTYGTNSMGHGAMLTFLVGEN